MNEFNKRALLQFKQYLELDQSARAHTLNSYILDLKQFFLFYPHQVLSTFNENDIENYFQSLHEKKQKSKTIARKMSSLRQFFLFLCREEILDHNPTENLILPKMESHLPSCLSLEEIEKILKTVEECVLYKNKNKEALQTRDSAMLFLLYATGLRVSELLSIRLEKCDLKTCLLKIEGKGGKERLVPFFEKIALKLENYIENARPQFIPKTSHLFLNQNGSALTRQAFFQLLQKYSQLSGIQKKISPHTFRHTYATHLLQSGIDLRSLQTLLGHSDLSTTQIYTHIHPEHLKESHKKHHPRGGG